jgi:hypothetical protein
VDAQVGHTAGKGVLVGDCLLRPVTEYGWLQVLFEVGRSCPELISLYCEHDSVWAAATVTRPYLMRSTALHPVAAGCPNLEVTSSLGCVLGLKDRTSVLRRT